MLPQQKTPQHPRALTQSAKKCKYSPKKSREEASLLSKLLNPFLSRYLCPREPKNCVKEHAERLCNTSTLGSLGDFDVTPETKFIFNSSS